MEFIYFFTNEVNGNFSISLIENIISCNYLFHKINQNRKLSLHKEKK